MGNSLLDISAVVEPEYLLKYELGADNVIIAEAKHKLIFCAKLFACVPEGRRSAKFCRVLWLRRQGQLLKDPPNSR
jgi:hypothetical protein